MKSVGIELKSNEIIMTILNSDGERLTEVSNDLKKITLQDDESQDDIKNFMNVVHTKLREIAPDVVGIIKRNKKPINGDEQKMSSVITFKIEAIIQVIEDIKITLIHSATIAAYLRKKPIPNNIAPKYKYQEKSFNLAYYLLDNEV